MLEILKFIFSEWYIFWGTLLLIVVIGDAIADIISAIRGTKHKKEK